jgi:queuine tRNA-ribosyltransferase
MSGACFGFEVLGTDGAARLGRIRTPRGDVETPAFMPVGTAAAVKGLTPEEAAGCGAGMILANTYHLFLRPGHETIAELGGLHRFMNWPGPILTDSGGYQVFSLAGLRKLDDDGVRFRSHIDGSTRALTPETSMAVQAALGSDVAMVLDECPALPAGHDQVAAAVARTTRWARRCREAYDGPGVPFGIVQGGTSRELREQSARELLALDFPGYAIGGVSVGEPGEMISQVVGFTAELLPWSRPRYLMGVGTPADLVEAVAAGVDMFDCVMPTRNARNGTLFTSSGRLRIKRSQYARDPRPVDPDCPCDACRHYSRAYLRHLFVAGEILAMRLNTLHNLTYYLGLMARMREAIAVRQFDTFLARFRGSAEARSAETASDPESA